MNKKWLKRLFIGFLLLYCIAAVVRISTKTEDYQWDFKMFYHAAKIWAGGLNPYDNNILSSIFNIELPYVYPPVSLLFFLPFTLVNYPTAFSLFLLFKCLLLGGLLYLWKKEFLKEEMDIFFYLFCLLAFNNTIYLDIRAGNISILEQFLIWLGFYFYLKRKPILFCAFILMAASFKIMPILFLGLLWFSGNKKKHLYFFGSACIFLAYLFIQYITTPYLFKGFVSNVLSVSDEEGIINPSTFTFIKYLLRESLDRTGVVLPYRAKLILFFTVITPILTTIIIVSCRAFNALKSVKIKDRERMLLFFYCLTYTLISPRFKDYSYILLIVPAYFIIKRVNYIKAYPLLFIIAVLSYPVSLPILGIVSEYSPLIIAYGICGLYLYEIFALKSQIETNKAYYG